MLNRTIAIALCVGAIFGGLTVALMLQVVISQAEYTLPVSRWIIFGTALLTPILGGWIYTAVRRKGPSDHEPGVIHMLAALGGAALLIAVFIGGNWGTPRWMRGGLVRRLPPELKRCMAEQPIGERMEFHDPRVAERELEHLVGIGKKWLKHLFGEEYEPAPDMPALGTPLVSLALRYEFLPELGLLADEMRHQGYNLVPRRGGKLTLAAPHDKLEKCRRLREEAQAISRRMRDLYEQQVLPPVRNSQHPQARFLGHFVTAYEAAVDITLEAKEDVTPTPELENLAQWAGELTQAVTPALSARQWRERGGEAAQAKDRLAPAPALWTSGGKVIPDAINALRGPHDIRLVVTYLEQASKLAPYHAYAAKECGAWPQQTLPAFQSLQQTLAAKFAKGFPKEPDKVELQRALAELMATLQQAIASPATNPAAAAAPGVGVPPWEAVSLLATIKDYLGMTKDWNQAQVPIPGGGTKGLYDAIDEEWASIFLVGSPPEVNPVNCPDVAEARRRALAVVARHVRELIQPLIAEWTPPADTTRKAMPTRQQEALPTGRIGNTLPGAPFKQAGHHWSSQMPALKKQLDRTKFVFEQQNPDALFPRIDGDLSNHVHHNDAVRVQLAMVDRYLAVLNLVYSDAEKLVAGDPRELDEASVWYDIFEAGNSGGFNPLSVLLRAMRGLPEELPPRDANGKRNWDAVPPTAKRSGELTKITPAALKALKALLAPPPPPKADEGDIQPSSVPTSQPAAGPSQTPE